MKIHFLSDKVANALTQHLAAGRSIKLFRLQKEETYFYVTELLLINKGLTLKGHFVPLGCPWDMKLIELIAESTITLSYDTPIYVEIYSTYVSGNRTVNIPHNLIGN